MDEAVWVEVAPHAVWYGLPEEGKYRLPNRRRLYRRCRVQAFDSNRNSLGFLPLPSQYRQAWIQLCYNIIYLTQSWLAWVKASHDPPEGTTQEFLTVITNNIGTRLLQYHMMRRLIIDEILSRDTLAPDSDRLDVFDEYLIRDSFDWVWTPLSEIPADQRLWLEVDPVSPLNASIFDLRGLPSSLLPPPASLDSTWIWGTISHFDFDEHWQQSLTDLLEICGTRKVYDVCEFSWNPHTESYPSCWHESHDLPVQFLTEEMDRSFPFQVRLRASSVTPAVASHVAASPGPSLSSSDDQMTRLFPESEVGASSPGTVTAPLQLTSLTSPEGAADRHSALDSEEGREDVPDTGHVEKRFRWSTGTDDSDMNVATLPTSQDSQKNKIPDSPMADQADSMDMQNGGDVDMLERFDGACTLLDYHMQSVLDAVEGNPELTKPVHLLEFVIKMVKRRVGFALAKFHLERVQSLGKGDSDLEVNLFIMMEIVRVMRSYVSEDAE